MKEVRTLMARKTLTLDDINEAADEQYGHLEIPLGGGSVVKLINPLRLSDAKRKELKAWMKPVDAAIKAEENGEEASEDDEDNAFDKAAELIHIVAETAAQAEKLVKALGRDQAKLKIVIEAYFDKESAGKASSSES
jgi:hypothetical protein